MIKVPVTIVSGLTVVERNKIILRDTRAYYGSIFSSINLLIRYKYKRINTIIEQILSVLILKTVRCYMLHNMHRIGNIVNYNRVHTRNMFVVVIFKIRYYYWEKIKTNQSEYFQKYSLALPQVLIYGAYSRRT